jgi:hypothetical protein
VRSPVTTGIYLVCTYISLFAIFGEPQSAGPTDGQPLHNIQASVCSDGGGPSGRSSHRFRSVRVLLECNGVVKVLLLRFLIVNFLDDQPQARVTHTSP